jgi:hypothetical protein
MVCNAIIVAEGGVFSPRIALWLGRIELSLKSNFVPGVGVPCLEGLSSRSLLK